MESNKAEEEDSEHRRGEHLLVQERSPRTPGLIKAVSGICIVSARRETFFSCMERRPPRYRDFYRAKTSTSINFASLSIPKIDFSHGDSDSMK
jgi:hypothetical protein